MDRQVPINYLGFGVLFFVVVSLIALTVNVENIGASTDVYFGVVLDLVITIPILYTLTIWKTKIPKITIVYVIILGLLLGSYIIPDEHQLLLSQVKYFLIPLLELSVFALVVYKFTALRSSFKKSNELDFFDKLNIACHDIFPNKIGNLLATEIAVMYYLFNTSFYKNYSENEFTYHAKSGIRSVLIVLVFLLIIETLALHLLVAHWSDKVAWVLSILGIYAMFQIASILRSMTQRPIFINYDSNEVILRYGFVCQTRIALTEIIKVEKYNRRNEKEDGHICLSLFEMFDTNNLTIQLKKENTLHKIYGIRKKYKLISFYVDDKELFLDRLEKLIDK